jgi:hypothetical protein
MNFLRTMWKRIRIPSHADEVSPAFSYRIYWMKTSLNWKPELRERVLAELEVLMMEPAFERNPYQRRYTVPALAGSQYSGESLACLRDVLEALRAQPGQGEESHDRK